MIRHGALILIMFFIYLNGFDGLENRKIMRPQKTLLERYPAPMQKMIVTPAQKAIIYFDTTGIYAVDSTDTDENGSPDFVDIVAHSLDRAWYVEIDSLGHKAPINPNWWNKPIPVYLNEERLTYGGTYFLFPGTIEGEFTKFTGYIKINPNLSLAKSKKKIGQAIRVTIAHELYHLIQFSYGIRYLNSNFTDIWLLESTATSFEEFVYDDVNDYFQYLPAIQKYPWENGLISNSSSSYYGHCIFFLMLAQQMSDLAFMKSIWENQQLFPGTEIVSFLAGLQNKSLKDLLSEYLIWRYYTGSNWMAGFYNDGPSYPELKMTEDKIVSQIIPLHSIVDWGFEPHIINADQNGFVEPFGFPVLSIQIGAQGRWTRPDQPLAISKNLDYIVSFWDRDIPVSLGPDKDYTAHLIPNPVLSGKGPVFIKDTKPLERIIIYNILGQQISVLQSGGSGNLEWDLTDHNSHTVGSGIYFIFYSETGIVEKCIILK